MPNTKAPTEEQRARWNQNRRDRRAAERVEEEAKADKQKEQKRLTMQRYRAKKKMTTTTPTNGDIQAAPTASTLSGQDATLNDGALLTVGNANGTIIPVDMFADAIQAFQAANGDLHLHHNTNTVTVSYTHLTLPTKA